MNDAADKILADLARGMDSIFGATRVCKQCGMTVPADPMKHYHDDYWPDTRTEDDQLREARDYQREQNR